MEGHYRRKFSEEEILNLKDSELQKIERINQSTERMENAEAAKESQLKWRILFERTAPEMLPFIIYCIYMGSVALYAFVNINKYTDTALYIYLGILALVMILPLFVLPHLPFKKWFSKKSP